MQKLEPVIKNKFGEKLDTWVEIPDGPVKATVVMVHGFGTSKHETAGYFDDVSESLIKNGFRVIRFDFSGYGKSEGKQEEVCYSKQVEDLKRILSYVKENFLEDTYLFSQSMGTWVTSLCSPSGIKKTIFTGIPNHDTNGLIDRFVNRFSTRPGAIMNIKGISLMPRSSGEIQKIGQRFWQEIQSLDPVGVVREFSQKTKLLIVHWESDEIIGKDNLEAYNAIPTLKSMWLPGDHSVTKFEDRQNFIKTMLDFYNK